MTLASYVLMWTLMMAAMMLPSITPLAMRYPGTSKR
jgi:predicted metal-binding membrane protein